jgi:hypothetical protein
MAQRTDHALVGFDLNATRIRAVSGPLTCAPRSFPLDGSREELPMALSLQGRSPEVGRAGLALCRRAPHLACFNFLPELGAPRQWTADRHRLDAAQALTLVLQRLQPMCHTSRGLVFALPAYLAPSQVNLVASRTQPLRLPLLGSVAAPLAAALAAYAEQPWYGTAVVVDVDDQALSMVTLMAGDGHIQELDTRILQGLNLRVWKDRLLAAIADRCIQQSRRDPRDSAAAEQCLYDGLDDALDACRQGRTVDLVLQTPQWYQNLILQPEEVVQYCAPMCRPVVDGLESIQAATKPAEAPRVLLLTAAAGRLPGLVAVLQKCLSELGPAPSPAPPAEGDEDLVLEDDEPSLTVLAPDAVARAAHALAVRFHRRELPAGHLDHQAPVPPPQPVDAGPARLHFRGQDFLLNRPTFVLGRQPTCDLVFDSEDYPAVSGWHCEILYEHRAYILRDRSRHGTLVNDQPIDRQVTLKPGDWIRLGPDGPLLRFLGQSGDPRRLMTTA